MVHFEVGMPIHKGCPYHMGQTRLLTVSLFFNYSLFVLKNLSRKKLIFHSKSGNKTVNELALQGSTLSALLYRQITSRNFKKEDEKR